MTTVIRAKLSQNSAAMSDDLFRANAITHAGIRHFGNVSLTLSTGLMGAALALLLVVTVSVLALANTSYARRQVVVGSIDESNLSTIVAADFGTVGKILVGEGEQVTEGQYLGSILGLATTGATEREILNQLHELEQLEPVLD